MSNHDQMFGMEAGTRSNSRGDVSGTTCDMAGTRGDLAGNMLSTTASYSSMNPGQPMEADGNAAVAPLDFDVSFHTHQPELPNQKVIDLYEKNKQLHCEVRDLGAQLEKWSMRRWEGKKDVDELCERQEEVMLSLDANSELYSFMREFGERITHLKSIWFNVEDISKG
jgi:hypothetical protein